MAVQEDRIHANYLRRYGKEEGEKRWQLRQQKRAANPPKEPRQRQPKRRDPNKPIHTEPVMARNLGVVVVATESQVLARFFPNIWTEQDRLQAEEIGMLAQGLTQEVRNVDWLLRAYNWCFSKADKATPHIALVTALGMIALPRLANHGVLPDEMVSWLQSLQGEAAAPNDPSAGGSPVPMEAGPTYVDSWDNGVGQVVPDGVAVRTSPVLGDPEVEGGQGEVPDSGNGVVLLGDGGPTARATRDKAAVREPVG